MKRSEWRNTLSSLNLMRNKSIKNPFLSELMKFKNRRKSKIRNWGCSMSKRDRKECSSLQLIKSLENWRRKLNQLQSSRDLSKTHINELKTEQRKLRNNLKFQQLSTLLNLQSLICLFNPFLKTLLNVRKNFWRSNRISLIRDDRRKRSHVHSNLQSI